MAICCNTRRYKITIDNLFQLTPLQFLISKGPAAIANAIKDMRALTSLSMSANELKGAEAGKALGDALAANTVLKELDLSGGKDKYGNHVPNIDIAFVTAFTPGLSDNGAMTKFDISSNAIRAEGGRALAAGLKGNQEIMELNISSNKLSYNSGGRRDTSGVIAIADAITDMRAMTSLNLALNKLGVEGAKAIAACLPKCT
jgi:Ran GTPase-activating protein (RanGAP) involved in mRNA processing and transport